MKATLFIFILCLSQQLIGQVPISEQFIATYERIEPEQVYLHQNTAVALVGENISYTVYCINSEHKRLSTLSQIVHVSILNDKEIIHQQKIKLTDGVGSADFTIPVSTASGSYKIIAYTQWMRNFGPSYFFNSDLVIINPYATTSDMITLAEVPDNDNRTAQYKPQDTESSLIKLSLSADSYGQREQVDFTIETLQRRNSFGNYSVSVRAINPMQKEEGFSAENFDASYAKPVVKPLSTDGIYVPEINGELITGKVTAAGSQQPVADLPLTFSIPGWINSLKISSTNSLGIFYIDIPENYVAELGRITPLHLQDTSVEINLTPPLQFDTSHLNFPPIDLQPNDQAWLQRRSIDNQIENAYFAVKKDVITRPNMTAFKYPIDFSYVLDAYKRFPTVQETLVEVVENVFTSASNGERKIAIRHYLTDRDSEEAPLILMDGVFIRDQQDVLDYDVTKIEKIDVITEKFLYGNQYFGGVLLISTIHGDYTGGAIQADNLSLPLLPAAQPKTINLPVYDAANELDRIPDHRTQLYWDPLVKVTQDVQNYSFYTSDNTGWYQVSLEGFNLSGNPVTVKKYFEVKKSN